jgi:hypothetical protein
MSGADVRAPLLYSEMIRSLAGCAFVDDDELVISADSTVGRPTIMRSQAVVIG